MRLRDWLTVAALLLFIGASYAYMGHADAEAARAEMETPP